MNPALDPYEMAYTRESGINGATVYAQHADKNAAAVLFGIRTEQRHQPEYDHGRSMQLPDIKIESHQLMKHMAENLRREGFAPLEPAPSHGVNVAPPVSVASHQESLRLPPLHSALSMPQLMPLQHQNYHNHHHSFPSPRNLPSPHIPMPPHTLTPTSTKPYLPLPYHDSPHMHQQQQQHQQQHSMTHAVQHTVHHADAKMMDPDETEDEHERTSATPASRSCGRRTMCMFNGEECRENIDSNDDENPRKVVSHIFGRNKTCTVHIPDECWVWWCRKHYQRCRYHTDHWALKQIEILFENLTKIEVWGGVENFTLALRKRENDRNGRVTADKVPASRRRAAGRHSKNKNRSVHNNSSLSSSSDDNSSTPNNNNNNNNNNGPVKLNAAGRPVRSPVNIASPVPDFLLKHVGCQKSFDEVREILHEIRRYALLEKEENNKEVAFPDIEILPNYTEATLRAQGVPSGQLSGNNHSRRRRARKPISSTRGRPHPYASNAVF